jgi:hypothetical protein
MNWKTKAVIALVLVGALATAAFLFRQHRSQPGPTLTLRIAVTPSDQSDFVVAQANSAKFKYVVGKKSGVKALLAQKLTVTRVPNSSFVQATLHVPGQNDAQRYEEAFLQTLQEQCGGQAQLALVEKSIR